MAERWLPVVGYEGFYEVSDHGRLRTPGRTGMYQGRWGKLRMNFPARDMRASSTPTGYMYAALKRPNEKAVKHLVHRLVMCAFVGEPPNGRFQVNHKDGVKGNNNLSNLEYCSASQNLIHASSVLKTRCGAAMGSKFTESQVIAIRLDSRPIRQISNEHGVTYQCIHQIKSGKNWKHSGFIQSSLPGAIG